MRITNGSLLYLSVGFYFFGALFSNAQAESFSPKSDGKDLIVVSHRLYVLDVPEKARVEYINADSLGGEGELKHVHELRIDGKAVAIGAERELEWVEGYQSKLDLGGMKMTVVPVGGGFTNGNVALKMSFKPSKLVATHSAEVDYLITRTAPSTGKELGLSASEVAETSEWFGEQPLAVTSTLVVGQWQIAAARRKKKSGWGSTLFLVMAKLNSVGKQRDKWVEQGAVNQRAPDLDVKHWWGDRPKTSGSLVLLDFWATWCDPCVAEMPLVHDLYSEYKQRGLMVIGVHAGRVKKEEISEFLKEHPSPYPVCWDDEGVLSKYFQIDGIPHYVLIDRDGIVRWGGRWLKDVRPLIDLLLETEGKK